MKTLNPDLCLRSNIRDVDVCIVSINVGLMCAIDIRLHCGGCGSVPFLIGDILLGTLKNHHLCIFPSVLTIKSCKSSHSVTSALEWFDGRFIGQATDCLLKSIKPLIVIVSIEDTGVR